MGPGSTDEPGDPKVFNGGQRRFPEGRWRTLGGVLVYPGGWSGRTTTRVPVDRSPPDRETQERPVGGVPTPNGGKDGTPVVRTPGHHKTHDGRRRPPGSPSGHSVRTYSYWASPRSSGRAPGSNPVPDPNCTLERIKVAQELVSEGGAGGMGEGVVRPGVFLPPRRPRPGPPRSQRLPDRHSHPLRCDPLLPPAPKLVVWSPTHRTRRSPRWSSVFVYRGGCSGQTEPCSYRNTANEGKTGGGVDRDRRARVSPGRLGFSPKGTVNPSRQRNFFFF